MVRDPKDDPKVRDGKRLSMSGYQALPTFLGFVFVGIPLWVTVLLPSAVVSGILGIPFKKRKAIAPPEPPATSTVAIKPLESRKFDLVLFGATGFTGGLAAKYLAKNYTGSQVRWAIAGRQLSKLEAVRDELCKINPKLATLELLVADTSKPETLSSLVDDTRVVITTVGPFAQYGTPLVAKCAERGTGYCDITGETDWFRQMIDRFDGQARKSGARIVSFCGHDCVPWDLLLQAVAAKIKSSGEAVKSATFYDEIRSQASGGTMETVRQSLTGRAPYKATLGFDPLLKSIDGSQSSSRMVSANQAFLSYSSENRTWVGPFVMAAVMANCIRRSNAVNQYGPKVVYKEAAVYSGFMAGFVQTFGLLFFGTALMIPPTRWLMYKYLLPKPGEGPSEKTMDGGFLKVTAVVRGDKGSKATGMIYFPTDPGYRDTARMLVESGLALALDGDKISAPGGVWTPASCQGPVLLRRLEATGTTIRVD